MLREIFSLLPSARVFEMEEFSGWKSFRDGRIEGKVNARESITMEGRSNSIFSFCILILRIKHFYTFLSFRFMNTCNIFSMLFFLLNVYIIPVLFFTYFLPSLLGKAKVWKIPYHNQINSVWIKHTSLLPSFLSCLQIKLFDISIWDRSLSRSLFLILSFSIGMLAQVKLWRDSPLGAVFFAAIECEFFFRGKKWEIEEISMVENGKRSVKKRESKEISMRKRESFDFIVKTSFLDLYVQFSPSFSFRSTFLH